MSPAMEAWGLKHWTAREVSVVVLTSHYYHHPLIPWPAPVVVGGWSYYLASRAALRRHNSTKAHLSRPRHKMKVELLLSPLPRLNFTFFFLFQVHLKLLEGSRRIGYTGEFVANFIASQMQPP